MEARHQAALARKTGKEEKACAVEEDKKIKETKNLEAKNFGSFLLLSWRSLISSLAATKYLRVVLPRPSSSCTFLGLQTTSIPQKLKHRCVSVAYTTSEANLDNLLMIVLGCQSIPPLKHIFMLKFSGLASCADPPRSTYI